MDSPNPRLQGPFKLRFQGQLVGTVSLTSAEHPGGCYGFVEYTPFGESMREAMQLLTEEDSLVDSFEVLPESYVDDANWTIENAEGNLIPIFLPALHPDGEVWWMPRE